MKSPILSPCPFVLGLVLASPLSAQGPQFNPFGDGCPGTHGTPALDSLAGDLPQLGEDFSVDITNLPPGGFAVGILGQLEPIDGLGVAPPVDLTGLGMPGCTLYTSLRYLEGLLISGGRSVWTFRVPGDLSLMGFTFVQQAMVLDPGANAVGYVLSNAAQGIVGDRPELTITSGNPTLSSRTLFPGEWVDMSSFTMKNESFYVASGDFETGWYLSGNSFVGSSDDTLLYSRSEASLAPRENRIVPGRSLRIPFGIPPGSYWIGPVVDHENAVEEWAEFPNFKTIGITVTEPLTPLPDLTFPDGTPAAAPTSVLPGDTVEIKPFRIANQGNYPATMFHTGIYLSPYLDDLEGGTLLHSFSIGGLVQGLPFNVASQSVVIPAGTPAGNYWLGFAVDRTDDVPELDETNNLAARLITVQPVPTLPDLDIFHFEVTDPVVRPFLGLPIPVPLKLYHVRNSGGTASGPFRVGFYFSPDDHVTTGDRLIKTINVPSLAPGESLSYTSLAGALPFYTPSGGWYVGAIVDDTNLVAESNEDNNVFVSAFVLF